MEIQKVLRELLEDRRQIDVCIAILKRLAAQQSGKVCRGRPPKWLSAARASSAARPKKGGRKKK